eukprot:973112-Pleurochrysis_carterae.AAC.3
MRTGARRTYGIAPSARVKSSAVDLPRRTYGIAPSAEDWRAQLHPLPVESAASQCTLCTSV